MVLRFLPQLGSNAVPNTVDIPAIFPSGTEPSLHTDSRSSFIDAEVPEVHPAFESCSGGYFGALQRTLSGVPPYIWIENTIDEPITVVVSKFKACAISGGQKFYHPATTKQIPAHESAVFPLWTRKSGYEVLTIYKGVGDGKVLCIENDRVQTGYQARFQNSANLKLYHYKGKPVREKRVDPLYRG